MGVSDFCVKIINQQGLCVTHGKACDSMVERSHNNFNSQCQEFGLVGFMVHILPIKRNPFISSDVTVKL